MPAQKPQARRTEGAKVPALPAKPDAAADDPPPLPPKPPAPLTAEILQAGLKKFGQGTVKHVERLVAASADELRESLRAEIASVREFVELVEQSLKTQLEHVSKDVERVESQVQELHRDVANVIVWLKGQAMQEAQARAELQGQIDQLRLAVEARPEPAAVGDELRQQLQALRDGINAIAGKIGLAQQAATVEHLRDRYAAAGEPSHSAVCRKFEGVKQQVESLTQNYLTALHRAAPLSSPERRRHGAEFKAAFVTLFLSQAELGTPAEQLAGVFSSRLPETPGGADPVNRPQLVAAGGQFMEVVREMAGVRPPARPLVARPGEPFDPVRHQLIPGAADDPGEVVTALVFPGYEIESPPSVMHRAVVTTGRAATGSDAAV